MHSRVLRAATPTQRECLFTTKCRVQNQVCSFIIDSGSETNAVSKALVEKLGLKTTKHPHPYKLSWVDQEKKVAIRKQCSLGFKIGSYEDTILCDVVPMDACDVLMGRPWQSDRKSMHDGVTNVYTIMKDGVSKILKPLPPKEAPPSKEVLVMAKAQVGAELHEEPRLDGYMALHQAKGFELRTIRSQEGENDANASGVLGSRRLSGLGSQARVSMAKGTRNPRRVHEHETVKNTCGVISKADWHKLGEQGKGWRELEVEAKKEDYLGSKEMKIAWAASKGRLLGHQARLTNLGDQGA